MYRSIILISIAIAAVGAAADSIAVPSTKTLILPVYQFGLANRLRLIVSGVILADRISHRLLVDWQPSLGCNVSLSDLIDADMMADYFGVFDSEEGTSFILQQLYAESNKDVYETQVKFTNSSHLLVASVGMEITVDEEAEDFLFRAQTTVLKSNSMFLPANMSCEAFYLEKADVYSALLDSVVPSIKDAASSVLSSLPAGRSPLVGVHLRAFDAEHDWNVIPPQPPSSPSAQDWADVSPTSLFTSTIKAMHASNPSTCFLAFSNSRSAKKELVDSLPKNVIYSLDRDMPPGGSSDLDSRSSPSSIQLAMVDFVLLASCSFVIHSFGSSFGEEASAARTLPSLRIRRGGNIYGVDTDMEYCNNLQLGEIA